MRTRNAAVMGLARLAAIQVVILVAALVPLPGQATLVAQAQDQPVFDDALGEGWQNWSWDTTIDLDHPAPTHTGSASLAAQITGPWGGVYLAHPGVALPAVDYVAVRFYIHGGADGGQQLAFKVIDGAGGNWDPFLTVEPAAGAWTEVTVELSALGSPASIGGLVWQDQSGGPLPTFYLDDVVLVSRSGPPPPPGTGPALQVDASAGRHPISPDIYGMNFAGEDLAAELRLPVRRWGGNSTTRYNWQLDMYNTANDWFFENTPAANDHPELLPDGSSADRFVEQDRRTGTRSLLTMPMIGWTAHRRVLDHPLDCGFKVSVYGPQQSTDPWDPDCGNGVTADGGKITGNDPADTSVAIGPGWVQAWIQHLTAKYGTAAEGGVRFYGLDNEPMLWPDTHRDVHPELTSYDEILARTLAYAAAIKAADPTALTLGPVTWGWCAWFYSALDGCTPGTDYQSHGQAEFTPWYLAQLRAYEQQHGQRLLDYLDLHVYPQGEGVFDPEPGSPATQALRLRSTRALWDPTYVDETWIAQPIALIPLMRSWVDQHYPGTRLSLSEYNWGALGHINGALAQADLLGIFGRQGLHLATLWDPPQAAAPGAFAFRIYRNYDGAGGAFGQTSVYAASADQDRMAIYAAQRAADGALTLVVINKTAESLTSSVTLSGLDHGGAAQVYRYSAAQLDAIVRAADQPLGPTGFSAAFPAYSITLLVVPPATQPHYRVYLPLVLRDH